MIKINTDFLEKVLIVLICIVLSLAYLTKPEEEVKEQTEPYQRKVAAKHKKMKIRLIGKGKGKHTAGPYKKKPSNKRSKSAPPAG